MRCMARTGIFGLGIAAMAALVGCAGEALPPPAVTAGQPAAAPAPMAAPPADYDAPRSAGGGGWFNGDAQPPPAPPPRSAEISGRVVLQQKDDGPRAEVAPPAERPGLGTQWGETRSSHISMVGFDRADPSSPFATAALFYNDEEGARAMTSASGFRRTSSGMFTVAGGLVSVGLREEGHGFFPGFVAGGRSYAVGEAGHRYTIVLRNNTNARLEVVMSVDGLDVLDGKGASFGKRGYIVDPRGEIEVDGFRQSLDAVAAFRFGSVRGSYAGQKTGDTRNVGVIGIALFNEMGSNPVPWTPDEIQRRRDANPFPGQFATPP